FCVVGIGSQQAAAQGPFVYVTYPDANSVTVIDSSLHAVVATIPLCTAELCPTIITAGLAVKPGARFVYVAEQNQATVAVIDQSTNAITPILLCGDCGATPTGVAIPPDGSRVYVTDPANNAIDVISTSSNTVTDTIAIPFPPGAAVTGPTGIAITP